jgi:alpha-glucosidase
MKALFVLAVCAILSSLIQEGAAQSSYDLRSPDGRIEMRIRTADRLRYDLVLKGRAVLENATISLDVEHNKLGLQPKVVDAKTRSTDQVVEPVVRQQFAKIRDHYTELRLNMDGGYFVVFRAYNEGVAYRFETSLPQEKVKVYGEESTFNFTSNFVVYYPQEDSFYSHNERKYLPQHLSEITTEFIATLPAVVDVGQGAKLAIAESDLDDYPGLWLHGTGGTGLAATFPPYPLKEVQTSDRDYKPVETADYIAVTSGKRTFPWRVIGIADHDGDLLTNQIVYLLQRPSQFQDTSWIKPGVAYCGMTGTSTALTQSRN